MDSGEKIQNELSDGNDGMRRRGWPKKIVAIYVVREDIMSKWGNCDVEMIRVADFSVGSKQRSSVSLAF